MIRNVGNLDKFIRILIAGFLVLAFLSNTVTGFAALGSLFIAGVLILTSVVGRCPIYTRFNWNTIKSK